MRLAGIALVATALSDCAAGPKNVPDMPIIDMAGIDQTAYSRDLAACVNDRPFIVVSGYMAHCMKAKGYKVLASY